ncbi:MAG: hypothetical protein M1522_06795 [Actinobacteria bacterium]|nr:hypothetical protein [Actinomycetota bacterium]
MFPGPGAQIYRNEAGEPIGWDYPGEYEPDYESENMSRADAMCEELHEDAYEAGFEAGSEGADADAGYGADVKASWQGRGRCPADADSLQSMYADGYANGSLLNEDDEDDEDER